MSSSYDYSSSDDEWDLEEEEEDIAMILALHANKRSKHGGSVFGWQILRRERIEGRNKLIRSYFVHDPIYLENYFWRHFQMSIKLFDTICECVMRYDSFFEQRGMPPESLAIAPSKRSSPHCACWHTASRLILLMNTWPWVRV
jgi:hypothetical protein